MQIRDKDAFNSILKKREAISRKRSRQHLESLIDQRCDILIAAIGRFRDRPGRPERLTSGVLAALAGIGRLVTKKLIGRQPNIRSMINELNANTTERLIRWAFFDYRSESPNVDPIAPCALLLKYRITLSSRNTAIVRNIMWEHARL